MFPFLLYITLQTLGAYHPIHKHCFDADKESYAIWSTLNLGTPDPNGVWTAFRGVLWIAASIFGLSQVPLILKNMTKDEERGPVSPDTGL